MDEEHDKELEDMIAEMQAEQDKEEDDENVETEDDSDATDENGSESDDEDRDGTEEDAGETEDNTGDNSDRHEDESTDGEEDGEDNNDSETEDSTSNGFEPVDLDVNGTKVTVDNMEDLIAYAKNGAKTFNKEETHVNEKSIIDQGELSADDLKLMVDAKNGSKEAIAKLAKMGDVDLLDVDPDSAEAYKSTFEPTSVSEVNKVATEIAQDADLAQEFGKVAGVLPKDFQEAIGGNASMLKDFARHVKDGIAQEIIPKALTEQMVNGGSFMDAYTKMGNQIMQGKQETTQVAEQKQEEEQRDVSDRAQKLRDKANKSRGSKQTSQASADDVWDQSEEEFDEMIASGRISE